MSGQEVLVGAAFIAAAIYLFARSRRARARAKAQSHACARCAVGNPDRPSGALAARAVGTVDLPPMK